MLLVAFIYGAFFADDYESPKQVPPRSMDDFSFGLCAGLTYYMCDPDWRICVCSCCCAPVRWADTVGSERVNSVNCGNFWMAVFLFSLLQVLASLTGVGIVF